MEICFGIANIGKFHQFLYACLKNGTVMLRGMASVHLSITFFVSG